MLKKKKWVCAVVLVCTFQSSFLPLRVGVESTLEGDDGGHRRQFVTTIVTLYYYYKLSQVFYVAATRWTFYISTMEV